MLWLRLTRPAALHDPSQTFLDVGFTWLLLITGATGLILLVGRETCGCQRYSPCIWDSVLALFLLLRTANSCTVSTVRSRCQISPRARTSQSLRIGIHAGRTESSPATPNTLSVSAILRIARAAMEESSHAQTLFVQSALTVGLAASMPALGAAHVP